MSISEYFAKALREAEDTPGLTQLLNQPVHGKTYLTLFDIIQFKLWGHESMSPAMYNDIARFCGSTFIELNEEIRPLLNKKYRFPVLDVQVSVETETNNGIKVIWKKVVPKGSPKRE